VCVVDDPGGKTKPIFDERPQLEACPTGKIVGRGKNGSILSVDRSGAGNAEARGLNTPALGRRQYLLHGLAQTRRNYVPAAGGFRGNLRRQCYVSLGIDQGRLD
jgi:hypothetical protein